MIEIVIRKSRDDGSYQEFTCSGHAGYAKKNMPDIVCCAVSTITIGTIGALEDLAGEELSILSKESTGYLKCRIERPLQEKSVFLLDSMVFILQQVEKEYGKKYLQVKFEEV